MSLNQSQINVHFIYALNELRALEICGYKSGTDEGSDRVSIADRFREMADSIESGGVGPEVSKIIPQAMALPIQN